VVLSGRVEPSRLLYFSLATLTTLGYGDIVAVRPSARMFATLEAAAGVLYIAIFVASLVASYQSTERKAV
jgi:Ion channel